MNNKDNIQESEARKFLTKGHTTSLDKHITRSASARYQVGDGFESRPITGLSLNTLKLYLLLLCQV